MTTNYCRGCGKKLHERAEMCPKCGVRQRTNTVKSKTIAILIAIFFSNWTWLYTYKDDADKFWMGFIINFVGLFFLCIPNLLLWIYAVSSQAVKDEDYWNDY